MEDAGALPIECDVTQMNTGDVIVVKPTRALSQRTRRSIAELQSDVILDEFALVPNPLSLAVVSQMRARERSDWSS